MIKHTVYKTTNLINGKIYIGVHKQTCEKDWYLGSGKTLHNAIKKYGRGCFAKETLFELASTEETKSKWQKCLIVDGVKYASMSDVAVKYSISNSSVTHRVKSALDKWKDWNYA